MNYYVLRNGQRYGPYTLGDLQRYVGSGDILPTDLAQSEGMQDWVQVSQVIGNVSVVQPPQPPIQNYGRLEGYVPPGYVPQGYGGYGVPGVPAYASQYPTPPDLHWGILLLLEVVTCFLFGAVWMFVQSIYVKRIDPNSKGTMFYALNLGCGIVGRIVVGVLNVSRQHELATIFSLVLFVACIVLAQMGNFDIKASLENHFNTAEPINLQLSGPMTFFFSIFYFQYHFNRINNWRRRGILM
jgi:multidrug transporter EmrE-like cation transporter